MLAGRGSRFAFDEKNGELIRLSEKGGVDNPTYLTVHEGNRCVYANSEVFGWNEGTISAYRLDPRSGGLSYINKQPALGSIPADNSLDRSGRFVFVANYSVYAEPDDTLTGSVSGRNTDPLGRRTRSRRVAAVPILQRPATLLGRRGRTPIASLRVPITATFSSPISGSTSSWFMVSMRRRASLSAETSFSMKGGAGPRHFVFHPSARYNLRDQRARFHDRGSRVRRGAEGKSTLLQTVSGHLSGYVEESHCAGLQLTPDGRYLYGSNLGGHDSLVTVTIDELTGRLSYVEHQSCLGRTPRDFAIDPS